MIEALARFIEALRKSGLMISPAEAIDAARAVGSIAIERRDEFRLALRATLVKRRGDLSAFDRVFDSFFAVPAPAGSRGRGARAGQGEPGRASRPAPPDLEGSVRGLPGRWSSQTEPKPRGRRGRLKVILRPVCPGRPEEPGRHSSPPEPGPRAGPRQMRKPRAIPRAMMHATPALGPASEPRRFDLSAIVPRGQERELVELLAREVPKLVQEIRLRAGRRLRRDRAGRVWTARVMRDSVGTGGVPFVLPYRRRRPRRPRVVVLVDVSWSVMRASILFLMMAREFLEANRRTSIHFFVDRCVDATPAMRRWDVEATVPSFERLLASLKDLDPMAPSDYGRAFYQAAHARPHSPLGPVPSAGGDTILVVLGDARSNNRDPQAWAFEDLASRSRRVIWLNPEPASRWDSGDSVLSDYLPCCDVVCEARDLDGIARGMAEIVRNL